MRKIDRFGILEYYTSSQGIKGKIKTTPEDFVVEEKNYELQCTVKTTPKQFFNDSLFFLKPEKKYVHATLVKKNYTTLKAVRLLQKKLGTRTGYAGLKDKRAITAQRISIPSKKFKRVKDKDLKLKNFHPMNRAISIGALWGNKFTITIRDNEKGADSFIQELAGLSNELPNFFGEQRFGSNNTHKIGKHLIKKEHEKAAKELLTNSGQEHKTWKLARKELGDAWPGVKGIRLPAGMWIEREFIKNFKGNFKTPFKKMNRNLLMLYVHAYQSYLFNKTLSAKILKSHELAEEELEVPGHRTVLRDDDLKTVLKEEGIKLSDFKNAPRKVHSGGSMRRALMKVHELKILKEKPLTIKFTLKKGSYATIVLKELIKS